ncbi:unnamed protein product [Callosobruchus maculatus]|uniref:J domain-containing protein n=1 Tax=Callosobruchus maculatus TaxID=64391 RepID=A0A653CCE5_CALMS|nr:unnamed protein product [Callosobruchus maculatus]
MLLHTAFLLVLCLFFVPDSTGQLLEGLYCGRENCYDVLNVTRDATKSEISKSYRQLARRYHPDLHRSAEAKEQAAEKFKIIANAYEILKDDESRNDYDYMLDNPDEYYSHYYRYYRRRVAPKVDVRIVIVVTITIISAVQYFSGWQRYNTAIRYFATVPKYRNRAMEIAKEEGLLPESNGRPKGKHAKLSKDEIDEILRKVIVEKMDIKGAYARPTVFDLLWVQLVVLPYTVTKYLYWYMSWFVRHTLLDRPYEDEEKLYLIRRYMKMSQAQFDAQEPEKIDEFMQRKLWIRENFEEWSKEEEENTKKQLAASNRYKQYRRYLKNHGVGRVTFDDS